VRGMNNSDLWLLYVEFVVHVQHVNELVHIVLLLIF
jgi:hypothetical protein